MPTPGFILGLLTQPPQVSSGDGRGVADFANLRQRQKEFTQEQGRLRERDLADRQAQAAAQRVNEGYLGLRQQEFSASQAAAKSQEANAALDAWMKAYASGTQEEYDLATQNLSRYMSVEQIEALKGTETTKPAAAPTGIQNETDATRQLEKDSGLAGILEATGGPPATADTQGAAAPAAPAAPLPPAESQMWPTPKPLPPELQARPGEQPMGGPPPAPPVNEFGVTPPGSPSSPLSRTFAGRFGAAQPPTQGPPVNEFGVTPPPGGMPLPGSLERRMQMGGQPGQTVVRGPDGRPMFQVNRGARQSADIAAMDRTFDGLAATAKDDGERRAAAGAKALARGLVTQRGISPKEAAAQALDTYNKFIGARAAEKVARGGKDDTGGGGLGGWGSAEAGVDTKDLKELDSHFLSYVEKVSSKYDLRGLAQQSNRAKELAKLATSNTGFSQRAAVISAVKRLFGSNPANKETEFVMRSGGRLTELENTIRGYVDSGRLDDDFMRAIQEYANESERLTNTARGELARTVYEAIRDSPYFEAVGPDIAERYARNAANLSTEGSASGWARQAKPQNAGKKKPVAKAAAGTDQETADLLGQLPE